MAGSSILERGLNILLLFDKRHSVMNITEISKRVDLSTSTVYRYITTLKSKGLIEEDVRPGYYRVGLKILELARTIRQRSIIEFALPIMENLASQTGETIILAGVSDHRGICLEKVEGYHNLRVSYERGATFYLHAGATGKALMAYMSEKEQDVVIRVRGLPKFTENTITDPIKLKNELQIIREQGFAVSEGEVHQGVRAIAAPILNDQGRIIADLTMGAPVHRLEGGKLREMIHVIVEKAKEITRQMDAYSG